MFERSLVLDIDWKEVDEVASFQCNEYVTIRGRIDPNWEASCYFTTGIQVKIPIALLDNLSKAIVKLIDHYGDEYKYSVENGILVFFGLSWDGGLMVEVQGLDVPDDGDQSGGILESLGYLSQKRQWLMKMLDLPDTDEWSISLGINGCY
jgi:hypothetical protein